MQPETVEAIQNITSLLQLILCTGSVIALLATVQKTVNKPNRTQDERLDALEKWREMVDERLVDGENHFCAIDEGNRVTQASLLALMNHAVNGNDIENLKKARDELQSYLVKK